MWIKEIVDKIIEKYPNESFYTCSCGLSTTGLAHAGNFREIIITYFITEELKLRGKQTRFILSFDDFDRFKKVPFGIDKSYEQFVGMANYDIPSPFNDKIKYAEYYEQRIENELKMLGIVPEFIRQSQKYNKHEYDDVIRKAIIFRDDIFKIVSRYKTQTLDENDAKGFFPIRLYCPDCKKDSTTIEDYNYNTDEITFNCKCGSKRNIKLKDGAVKLNFNIDWPMRWSHEKVNFEPCGKGHSGPMGVLKVSRDISQFLFDNSGPVVQVYEFLKTSNNGRMNKNSSEIVTISNLLEIMSAQMVLWLYATNKPSKEMTISLDESIISLYKKYENFVLSDNSDDVYIKNMLNVEKENLISFSTLINYLPKCDFKLELLQKYIKIDLNNSRQLALIKYATVYLKKYCKDKYWVLNKTKNQEYWETMTIEEKNDMLLFKEDIINQHNSQLYFDFIETMKMKNQLPSFYRNFYNLIFNSNSGIPIRTIIENYDLSKINELLDLNREHNKKIELIKKA